ncbi:MarR family transcriptional regulator [Myxococcus sp. CA056]|uniref:MarR family winged helix-turn-helix transcriptional regulator n=1 Tax=unclassified Myxococcus TaxID=2648731 RepID=UPI00157BB3D5|nr:MULTISPECIES: MarR family transcriptional regulator [unclassified Myxococcus]NTX17221.1 MarR family transcriptional regulator [Myxococcus sp. CA056]NTX49719.1 MarR family transcriptional regulator [Myxococcus sp. CA039A]
MQHERKARAWNPESTSAYWINRASRLLMRLHESRLRPLGLGMSQLPVLTALEDGGTLSQKTLAERARVEQPTMAEMLARMERDGVVLREPNPEDKRASLTSLTPQARARLPEAKAALMRGEDEATAGFTQKEKALLRELLQRVVQNLETEG